MDKILEKAIEIFGNKFNSVLGGAILEKDVVFVGNKFKKNRLLQKYSKELTEVYGGTLPNVEILPDNKNDHAEKSDTNKDVKKCHIEKFPLSPEVKRVSPNIFLRSAIFPAVKGKKLYLSNVLVSSQNGYTIRYSGPQLNQSDFDVWLHAAHLARNAAIGTVCEFTCYSFLIGIGRSPNGGASYSWLKDSLVRLDGAKLELKQANGKWRIYDLIEDLSGDETTSTIKVSFNEVILELFGIKDWTFLDWEYRLQLKNKPLALWLLGFYSSHAKAYDVKIETLMRLSGSETKDKYNFKKSLVRAFKDLEVAGIKAVFKKDIVRVTRKPTASQAKYLSKAKK